MICTQTRSPSKRLIWVLSRWLIDKAAPWWCQRILRKRVEGGLGRALGLELAEVSKNQPTSKLIWRDLLSRSKSATQIQTMQVQTESTGTEYQAMPSKTPKIWLWRVKCRPAATEWANMSRVIIRGQSKMRRQGVVPWLGADRAKLAEV